MIIIGGVADGDNEDDNYHDDDGNDDGDDKDDDDSEDDDVSYESECNRKHVANVVFIKSGNNIYNNPGDDE